MKFTYKQIADSPTLFAETVSRDILIALIISSIEILVSKYYSSLKGQDEPVIPHCARKQGSAPKWWDMTEGHRRQPEEAPKGQIWDTSIKIHNEL